MSISAVYTHICEFQEEVIGSSFASERKLTAPINIPSTLDHSHLPIFINSFGRFSRQHLAEGVYEYRGSMQWTLYTSIAGVRDETVNQFDTINWINESISKIERYKFLEIGGTKQPHLLEPVLVQTVEPLLSNLRYAGNKQLLFWGGRLTVSVVIAVDKDCT